MRQRRYAKGHPWMFVLVCGLMFGAIVAGAWLVVATLAYLAVVLVWHGAR